MSKTLVEVLLQLFAIIVKEDNVTNAERDKIIEILKNQLNEELVQKYIQFLIMKLIN